MPRRKTNPIDVLALARVYHTRERGACMRAIVQLGALSDSDTHDPGTDDGGAECDVQRAALKVHERAIEDIDATIDALVFEQAEASVTLDRLRTAYDTTKAELVALQHARVEYGGEELWWWQADGTDDLDSLACPIVIQPEQMKELLADARTDERRLAAVRIRRLADDFEARSVCCNRCGRTQHRVYAKFCGDCGSKLPIPRSAHPCEQCGHTRSAHGKRCHGWHFRDDKIVACRCDLFVSSDPETDTPDTARTA